MPTINIWRGDAQPVPGVKRLTPSNLEIGDKLKVTINNKTFTYELPDDLAYDADVGYVPAAIAGFLVAMETFQETAPEFNELTWSSETTRVNGDDKVTAILVTGPDDGASFDLTATTADSGAFDVEVVVLQAGAAATNEKQIIQLPGTPSGGTFTLTFQGQTTGTIAYNASSSTVQTALEGLSNIAPGDIAVSGSAGGPWTVEFTGTYAGVDVGLISADGSSLTGASGVTVATTTQGSTTASEVWEVVVVFQAGSDDQYVLSVEDPDTLNVTNLVTTTQRTEYYIKQDFEATMPAGATVTIGEIETVGTETQTTITYRITFGGTWAGRDITLYGTSVYGSVESATVTTITAGGSAGSSEVQTVTITGGPTGGTFTLTFDGQTTSTIAYNASAATVETALEALSNITAVAVTKSGWVYTVTFSDPSGNVSQMTGSGSSLTGGTLTIATTQEAESGTNEKQLVSLTNSPQGGTFTLTFDGETTSGIAYNASASTVQTALEGLSTPVSGDFTVTGNAGGPWTVEFKQNYAATNVDLMTGSGASLTGAGTQTFVEADVTTPTGPNWANEAKNWSLGTAPADDEELVLQNSAISLKYGLSSAGITPDRVRQYASFTGEVGLPEWNPNGYREYRDTAWRLGTSGDGSNPILTIEVGEGTGSGSTLSRYNTGDKKTKLIVHRTGTSSDGNMPSLNWIGTHADNEVLVISGNVGVGAIKGQSATVKTLYLSYANSIASDADVVVGDGVTLGSIIKTGGVLVTSSGADFFENFAGDARIEGDDNLDEIIVHDGTVICNTSGIVGRYGTITGATKANPCVITSSAHGLSTGDKIRIASVGGMTELNQREFRVSVVDANSFQLVGENSSSHTTYTSGGTWGQCETVIVAGEGVLDFSRSPVARQVAVSIDVYGDESAVRDPNKKVTTLTYGTGEFAVTLHYTTRDANLGRDCIHIRRPV